MQHMTGHGQQRPHRGDADTDGESSEHGQPLMVQNTAQFQPVGNTRAECA